MITAHPRNKPGPSSSRPAGIASHRYDFTAYRRQADLHADAEEATIRVGKAAPAVAQAVRRPLVRSDLPSAANHAEAVDGADGGLRQRA